jgi:hypothetical protein
MMSNSNSGNTCLAADATCTDMTCTDTTRTDMTLSILAFCDPGY